jgi:hypothetical protein
MKGFFQLERAKRVSMNGQTEFLRAKLFLKVEISKKKSSKRRPGPLASGSE